MYAKYLKVAEMLLRKESRNMDLDNQNLLIGILSVYCDKTRNLTSRLGFTAFPRRREHDTHLGSINAKKPANL